jgi:hypothetical protein
MDRAGLGKGFQSAAQLLGARLGLVTGADRASVDAAQPDPLRFLGSERVLGAPSKRDATTARVVMR